MLDNVREIHIEPTSICNAECPMCARNLNGKGINPNIVLGSLTTDWFKENLPSRQIEKLDKVFFCGNLGDPAACPELLGIIQYLKSCNDSIVIGLNSNGGLKTTSWWSRLGELLNGPLDYCVFSIDGLEDTNHLYRRNVQWDKVIENAKAFISTGASAHWDMLVFKHNAQQVNDARTMAYEIGFKWFRSKNTDRWDTYTDDLGIEPVERYTQPRYTSIVTCEKDRDRSVFLDYTGKFWPCCHMAEAYLNKIGEEMHQDIKNFSAKQLHSEYKQRLESNKPFYICRRACGTVNKRSQWKTEEQLG
jgi:MoaA/NifB/PqqE/SkfB family radical SAM enzyme